MEYILFTQEGDYVGHRGSIPKEDENLQYIENSEIYATFVKAKLINGKLVEGATEEEIQERYEESIPKTISQMRFRMQLILSGISIDSIYQMISTIEDPVMRDIVLTKFDYAQEMERNDESLNFMADKMGMTKEQVDQIFIDANNIQERK